MVSIVTLRYMNLKQMMLRTNQVISIEQNNNQHSMFYKYLIHPFLNPHLMRALKEYKYKLFDRCMLQLNKDIWDI
jgi:hypothetical protein